MSATRDERIEQIEVRLAYLERTVDALDEQVRLAFGHLDKAGERFELVEGLIQEALQSVLDRLDSSG